MRCGVIVAFAPSMWWLISIAKGWRSKWNSTCLPAPRIVRKLDRIAAERGYPRTLRGTIYSYRRALRGSIFIARRAGM